MFKDSSKYRTYIRCIPDGKRYEILLFRRRETSNDSSDLRNGLIRSSRRYLSYKLDGIKDAQEWNVFLSKRI